MFRTGNHNSYPYFVRRLKKVNLFKAALLLLLLGMIYGALLVGLGKVENIDQLGMLTSQFIHKRAEQSVFYTLANSFSSSMLLLVVLFLSGFCAVGQPLALFVPLFHGLGLGLSTAYLYAQRGWGGLLFCLLLILPSAILSVFALLLGTRESVRMSGRLFRAMLPDRFEIDFHGTLRLYLIRFLVLTGFEAAAAVVDSLCTFLFAGFF